MPTSSKGDTSQDGWNKVDDPIFAVCLAGYATTGTVELFTDTGRANQKTPWTWTADDMITVQFDYVADPSGL